MRKIKLFYFSLCVNFLFWLYIIFKIVTAYSALQPIQGTVTQVEKSGNRIPVYMLHLQEYKSRFASEGNGTLSLLKPPPRVTAQVRFYILKYDKSKTAKNDIVPAFGLTHYKSVDCYYYAVRAGFGVHLVIIVSSFMICCLNVLSYIVLKTKMNWRIFVVSLLLFFLLMLL